MNQPLSTLSLAQLVNSNHQAAAVFEKYHLDFCCKGKRSLEQACLEQELPLTQVTSELETVFANKKNEIVDFNKMSLAQLCDYIVQTHHAYVKNEMPQLYAYLHKVSSKHGERHPNETEARASPCIAIGSFSLDRCSSCRSSSGSAS